MGASGSLALLFELNADDSKAAAVVNDFGAKMPVAFRNVDNSLLTSRESARLLSEELGIHPRKSRIANRES